MGSIVEVVMKLSEEIKRKAVKLHKSRRREGLSSSLTQVQHELARKEGFQNFKHLKSQEIASETAARKADALNGTSGDPNLLKTLNEDLGIFMMQNGHRGVKALRPFDKGERVLFEKPTYWFSLGQDTLGYGLVWGLTGHIALNFPQALNEMLNSGFRPFFKPKLKKNDQQVLKFIASKTKLSGAEVKLLYQMIATYNLNTPYFEVHPATRKAYAGERAVICDVFSFINHSCMPNTYRPQHQSMEHFVNQIEEELIATRRIEEGEEITWSYGGDLPNELKNRQKSLRKAYGFWCFCTRCNAEKSKPRPKAR